MKKPLPPTKTHPKEERVGGKSSNTLLGRVYDDVMVKYILRYFEPLSINPAMGSRENYGT